MPSPFTSADRHGGRAVPVVKVCWAAKDGLVAPGAVVFSSTDTVPEPSQSRCSRRPGRACRRRSRPPIATANGIVRPWRRSAGLAKVGVLAPGAVVFSSTDTVCVVFVGDDEVGLAVAVHVRRSPRKSGSNCPWRRSAGLAKVGVLATRRRRVQQHRHRVRRRSSRRSGRACHRRSRPPPSRRPGPLPVAKVCWAAKVGVVAPGAVVFSSTDTVFESQFATIRSGLPSPFKSAVVTDWGLLPVAKPTLGAKLAGAMRSSRVRSTGRTT